MFRKLAPALAALLLTACATAGDEGAIEVKTGAEMVGALRAAPDAAAEAGTASFEMVMEMSFAGDTFELVATGAYDTHAERMSMEMDLGALYEQLAQSTGETLPDDLDGPMQMVADGTTFYMRAPMFELVAGTSGWLSLTLEDLGTSAEALGLGSYDPSKLLESLRGVVGEPVAVGTEEVRGVETTRYTATMDLAKAIEEAPEAQRKLIEAQLDQLGETEIPVDVWIDADGLPRRMQMETGGMFDALELGEGSGAVITIELFDYGEPVHIEIPSPDDVTSFGDVMGTFGGGFGDEGS